MVKSKEHNKHIRSLEPTLNQKKLKIKKNSPPPNQCTPAENHLPINYRLYVFSSIDRPIKNQLSAAVNRLAVLQISMPISVLPFLFLLLCLTGNFNIQ